ncbi:peroxisomal sarcosine oxidase-like [Ptychodera flava]|uniref:peroxisomal sarcosine oxidase-like n=1 Tax=Ptychodera flava TaxID=63121 RepID=UPI00396A421C
MANDIHKLYDLCIVGAGPMGSAAARHATLINPQLKVCLIGPKEPEDRLACSHDVFGSHYDEGRVVTALIADPIWRELASRSINRFRDIEERTGIAFFTQSGHLWIGRKSDPRMENVLKITECMGPQALVLDRTMVSEKYPFLSIRQVDDVLLQTKSAGFVSPRKLVLAQQAAAHSQGCDIFNDVVDKVHEVDKSDGSKCMMVATLNGHTYLAKRVLLTPGAFIGFRSLLPVGKELDLTLLKQKLAFIELNENDVRRLTNMPAIAWRVELDKTLCYILPPIKYPNGKYYLKIGRRSAEQVKTKEEVVEYLKRDPSKVVADKHILDLLLQLVKDIKVVSTHGDSCITTHTPNGQVYCDMVTPRLGVATAGQGAGVMVSDEIGNMAARMIISGSWDYDLPRENFRAKFRSKPES